jgi:hypothetical protein
MPVRDIQNNIIGISDLTDISDLQREWLRLEAEAYDSIRFSKPIVRIDPGLKVPAGGGGVVHGLKDCMEVHEIPVMDVEQIRNQQKQLLSSFDAYTGRGDIRTHAESIQSGISIVEERKSLHKRAQARARFLEKTEQAICNLVCYMMGIKFTGDIEYNSDYESRDTQYKIALLTQAKALSTNLAIQTIIDQEVIKLIAPPDEVAAWLQKVGTVALTNLDVKIIDDDYAENDADDRQGSGPMSGSMSSDAVQNRAESTAYANMNRGQVGSI